jgi:hypothetical protein
MAIDVEITGCGRVHGEDVQVDPSVAARCSLCGKQVEAAVSIAVGEAPRDAGSSVLACANCLRARLDALSVGRFRLREPQTSGIPWGKISG